MSYSTSLQALRRGDEPRFGGKSANLGELLAAGIPVPPGFALSSEAFAAFIDRAGLAGEITDTLAGLSGSDEPGRVSAVAQHIAEVMRAAPLPDAIARDVAASYDRLGAGSAPPVAVRSSAIGEDSQEATFAGQQETYLWIRESEAVCRAIRDCWISLYSAPAISYRARRGEDPAAASMAVTVQQMVDAVVSGVMFTCNPTSGDRSMIAINASWGLGLAVVGGEVTPDDYLISKVTGEVVREQIHDKPLEYVAGPDGRGTIHREVDADRRAVPCLERATLAALRELARAVERHFGSPQDIEWAIDRAGSVFVVQTRPVTAVAQRPSEPPASDALSLVMKTFGAVPR